MKNFIKLSIVGLAILFSFTACKQDKISEAKIQVLTYEFSQIKQTTAEGLGYVTVNNAGTPSRYGFCWSEQRNPTINDPYVDNVTFNENSSFEATLTGLAIDTRYYSRAFVEVGGQIHYGNEITFMTRDALYDGTVTIDDISNISPFSADILVVVGDAGNYDILEYGLVFNTTGDPVYETDYVYAIRGGNKSTIELDELEQDTKYYVKPYYITSAGVRYGDEQTFETLNFIKTSNALPGYKSAYLFGEVLTDADSYTSERGICWSTSPQPTIADGYKSSGSGTGSYYFITGGLEKGTTYYARAYAINDEGVFYGNELTFTTKTGDIFPGFSFDQMVEVLPGTFEMGEPLTDQLGSAAHGAFVTPPGGVRYWDGETGLEPVHTVQLTKGFWMSKFPITNVQLCTFLNVYQSTQRRDYNNQALYNGSGRDYSFSVSGSSPNLVYTPTAAGQTLPAANFTWGCGSQFIEWLNAETGLNFRMPTEAEWEWAARGGVEGAGNNYKYAGSNDSIPVAVFYGNQGWTRPQPAGSLAPNELGLYDMSGNYFDFCQDYYDKEAYLSRVGQVTVDPLVTGPKDGAKVMRGGSWVNDHYRYIRVSARAQASNEANCGNYSSMRLVIDVNPNDDSVF